MELDELLSFRSYPCRFSVVRSSLFLFDFCSILLHFHVPQFMQKLLSFRSSRTSPKEDPHPVKSGWVHLQEEKTWLRRWLSLLPSSQLRLYNNQEKVSLGWMKRLSI